MSIDLKSKEIHSRVIIHTVEEEKIPLLGKTIIEFIYETITRRILDFQREVAKGDTWISRKNRLLSEEEKGVIIEEWKAERLISPTWWRCPKCLQKKHVKKTGWSCTECKLDCEQDRREARQKIIIPCMR